jgi:hypothetical protein
MVGKLEGVGTFKFIGTDASRYEKLEITMVDDAIINVHFADHPSAPSSFETLCDAMSAAHGGKDAGTGNATGVSIQYSIQRMQKLQYPDKGCEFMALRVKGGNRRFRLSDGVVTHNCIPGKRESKAIRMRRKR